MKKRKIALIIMLILVGLACIGVAIYSYIKRIQKRKTEDEYKMAEEIMWFCNYTGKNESLESVCKEVGKHVFNAEEAIYAPTMQKGIKSGKGGTSLSRLVTEEGIMRCDFEFYMNMDNYTVQKCEFRNVVYVIDDYISFEKVMDYLPIRGLKKDGIIWRGTIKCKDGRKKPIVAKLWQNKYYIYIDLTKEYVSYGGEWAEGLLD